MRAELLHELGAFAFSLAFASGAVVTWRELVDNWPKIRAALTGGRR